MFYGFWNVIFSKKDGRKTVAICSFKRISKKLHSIVDYSALFSKEIVKSFLFEIRNVVIIILID